MAQYATTDDLRELTSLVRSLQGDVTTLNNNVGELDTLVERINHLSTLKDVTITYIKEGDLIQYSSDGTWHNVSPAVLADYISGEGGIIDTAVVKALIASEGGKLFLSKLYDDTALGVITFKNSVIADSMIYAKKGITIGNYISGLLGDGAIIDEHGNIEAGSLTLREFLSVPELRFNRVDVVSGELWNSIAFGTIESVDTKNQIATLKLEEGEYSGLHVNDICRGIWHNISGVNETTPGTDECGFEKMQGFSTAYFTPIEILDERGKQFRYSLKPNTTQHPTANMKFAVYGNFLDETRQSSAYSTRDYKRFLKDVSTWAIDWTNIASQFGKIEGLTIPGAPDDGVLHGDGAYLTNVYMTGAMIQFTPEQEGSLKGQDAYSVNLTKDNLSVIVDNELNILDKYSQLDNLTFGVQAFKGTTELSYSDVYAEGSYFLTWEATGLKCTMANGIFTITDILSVTNSPHIDLLINCEGNATFKKTVVLQFHLQPNSLWTTYNDNDAIPDRPTGDGTTNGWHRNYTASAIWMSTKSSIEVDDPNVEWGDPNRFRGASVAGKDGEYTRFAYTESSVPPPTPIGDTVPPKDPNNKYTWTMDPPQGDPEKGIWVWQSIQTVYSDKSTSGWSEPFRLTGADGKDGNDGNDIEFVYKITQNNSAPTLPANSNRDDYTEPNNGWYDNPQGVSETWQYEWVAQRTKPAAKAGTGNWGNWQGPTLWSKWGEKGMDGDGYEYIYYRTQAENIAPDTPVAANNTDDEARPQAFINGVAQTTTSPGGMYWTDDPQGVRENLMFEWVSVRKKTDSVWSAFQKPAIWAKWGETGLSGGNYQYRYKISATTPSIPTDSAASGWSEDSEMVPPEGQYVWQIHRFKNADGSLTAWTGLIRLTGADGKDGEDGNSIEFLYARNNNKDKYPQKPNSNQTTDWTGTGPDGTRWFDNPQGVDDSHRYEYVTQRYKDKSTQKWGDYSQPGLWSVFADKGKDGDGYEYIFARFSSYDQAALCSRNEQYYPASPTYGSQYLNGDYQQDDYIPTKTCKGATFTYTDNGVSVTESIPYQVCWTRKKENGKWGDWKDGFIWTKWGKDGQDGEDGDKGDQGDKGDPGTPGTDATTYVISPGAATIRLTRTASYEPSSMTFRAYKKTGTGKLTAVSGYWEIYGSNSSAPTSSSSGTEIGNGWSGVSSITFNIASSAKYNYYTVAFNPSEYPLYNDNPVAASATVTVVVDGQNGQDGSAANTQYTDIRFRGVWNSSTRYYYATASSIGLTNYENPSNAYVRDQVIYKGGVYLVKYVNSGGVYGQTPSSSSAYWELVSSVSAMAINTLLADNAVLGAFHFSNNIFWSGDGGSSSSAAKLYMNSSTGEFRASNGTFTGTVNAKAGTFKDLYFENCFTKNRFLNITHLNRSSSDIDNPKYGDTYCSNSRLYSYQSDGWEDALEIYTSSTNAISVYANPSYSKIIHMVGAKSGYTNKLILPSVSEDNYGTEMTIVCRQHPSIRAITGTEGNLHVTTYENRGNTYVDERTLVLAKGNNGGILNVVSTPQGWLITNCSHDGCSDSGIILKFKVQYNGSSYAVVSSSIHSIYNFNNSKISCTRSGAGAVGITITSGTSYFWTPCDVRVYGSYRTESVTGSNAHPIYATLISYSTGVTALNISVQLADDATLNDGNFYVDIYGGFAQYIGNKPT